MQKLCCCCWEEQVICIGQTTYNIDIHQLVRHMWIFVCIKHTDTHRYMQIHTDMFPHSFAPQISHTLLSSHTRMTLCRSFALSLSLTHTHTHAFSLTHSPPLSPTPHPSHHPLPLYCSHTLPPYCLATIYIFPPYCSHILPMCSHLEQLWP